MTVPGRVAAAVLTLFLTGCAARAGAPGASEPSVSAGGVEISATADAWRGWPAALGRVVTPVRVRVANRGATAVRVDTTTFALALPEGGRLAAMLPADVRGVTTTPAPAALPQAGTALGPTRERGARLRQRGGGGRGGHAADVGRQHGGETEIGRAHV